MRLTCIDPDPPTVSHKHLTIRSDPRQLKDVREAVLELAGPCLNASAHLIVLAVDEAVSNVMRHGGVAGDPAAGGIDVDIDTDTRRLEVRIAHRGPAYDPSAAVCEEPARRVLARQRGGMGISIMRRVMDEVRYTHSQDLRNELRLIKYIDRAAATD